MEGGRIIYLHVIPDNPSQLRKLDGIRRYAASRGWDVISVPREESSPGDVPALLRRYKPVGCVVEGIGKWHYLPPRLFRGVPVSYIGYPPSIAGSAPTMSFDSGRIGATAFRELSAGRPPCYAAVGSDNPLRWSQQRVRMFRTAVEANGAKCLVFPGLPDRKPEPIANFLARLAPWIAKLPQRCAVFAVSDQVGELVLRAARMAGRPVPRSMTLLSVDNFTDICEKTEPTLSSIQLDFERMGYFAAMAAVDGLPDPHPVFGPLLAVRRASTGGSGRRELRIVEAVETIRREACNGLTARALAARFHGSRRLFEIRFREATGRSVLDEILAVRLEKAFTLLSRTDVRIGAIPALCGFGCDRACDAAFRSRTGIGMREWRRRNAAPTISHV